MTAPAPGFIVLEARLERLLGAKPTEAAPLPVGFGLQGLKVRLSDGRLLAVKARREPAPAGGSEPPSLEIEGFMLGELERLSAIPVPHVHHAEPGLLVMDYIENDGGPITPAVERDAAALVASLHAVRGSSFGYGRDTLIGPLPQVNTPSALWLPFFAEHRLLAMGRMAMARGALPAGEMRRLERLAEDLDAYLLEPEHPALLHGDLWGGNILVRGERIAGFVDPAISFGHPEIELAFSTLFGTFGSAFFDAYEERRPLQPGFHELRKDIYNLYPLLVHVRLFGAGYLGGIVRTLNRLGF